MILHDARVENSLAQSIYRASNRTKVATEYRTAVPAIL